MRNCKICNVIVGKRKSFCPSCYKERRRVCHNKAMNKYFKTPKGKISLKKVRDKPAYSEYMNTYRRNRYAIDLEFKVMCNMRSRLYMFLKHRNIKKDGRTHHTIGLSAGNLTKWIQFNLKIDGLTEYELDHVIPLASFNVTTFKEIIESKCNHWTNLMPITEAQNSSKKDRPPTQKELFKQDLRICIFKLRYLNKS